MVINNKVKQTIKKLYTESLAVKKNEQILVLRDKIPHHKIDSKTQKLMQDLQQIGEIVSQIGNEFGQATLIEYDSTMIDGAEPPEIAWRVAFGQKIIDIFHEKGLLTKLLQKQADIMDIKEASVIVSSYKRDAVDVVIALPWFSTSHTRFRELLTNHAGTRYASMPRFDMQMFYGPLDANWKEVAKRSIILAEKLSKATKAFIDAPNGTSLEIDLLGRRGIADTGLLNYKGAFGNLPGGEAYIVPIEETAEGILIIEWTMWGKLDPPVKAEIKAGKVVQLDGDRLFVNDLTERFRKDPLTKCVAELGFGTNDKAKRPNNILEAEKIMGTIHIALGDNSSLGGKIQTSFHQDYVVINATARLEYSDGSFEYVLRDGQLFI